MYLCIYVSMYLCIYVFMYLCIYVFMYLCIYVSMHLCCSDQSGEHAVWTAEEQRTVQRWFDERVVYDTRMQNLCVRTLRRKLGIASKLWPI